ncbi:nitrous oxide-stimulated promoter family protein [Treponema phagedenis]|uniref:Nitrous oxide-stimulated promoter family protein n=1 Tax=Treponema phagedenis TaxID=162 RepID=A0A0B7GUH6_TREPH|nr:nitrous oxide-stimulated promoter family protein [Treponema phagedenis]EFW36952.1 hypothetical protein HMPREF9554_02572 [Treponema phagedenis F0421]NVP24246.1 nitrous oxide-stimulated promoter family protein [Treponema phagedenis]QEJ94221.1 nitrous oxide-stimulated promoter family protein [Treponema phagedenis]QEJ99192.1 nitrous oxide-stimulated promoter family protein [Treponema phagedenis]QEK00180.1 nitrous oxide-stimulated promoter family protein [Treponema phagedenis]
MKKRKRIEQEKKLVDLMIDMYVRGHKGGAQFNAEELKNYAHLRIEHCLYKEEDFKPFCNVCPIHCYAKNMREEIKKVMRYSGPRLLFRHPIMSIAHLISTLKSKKHPPPLPKKLQK